jgi:hypothetical protein
MYAGEVPDAKTEIRANCAVHRNARRHKPMNTSLTSVRRSRFALRFVAVASTTLVILSLLLWMEGATSMRPALRRGQTDGVNPENETGG